MYGKIIDGALVAAPEKYLEYSENGKHKIVCNPQAEHYLAAGYKPVEYGDVPEDTEEYTTSYVESVDKITVTYSAQSNG